MTITPRQFCQVCRVLWDKEVADVAALFVPNVLPSLQSIHEEAEEMADSLDLNTDSEVAMHLLEISDWAVEVAR